MSIWTRFGPSSCTSVLALAVLSAALPGCTLLGAGVGAGIDSLTPGPYEERAPTEWVRLERDQRVVVGLRNGTRVTGRYVGTHGPTATALDTYLFVAANESLVGVKISEVSSIALEVTGKGWLYGGLIGLVADAVVVVAVAVSFHNMHIQVFDDPSGCFC